MASTDAKPVPVKGQAYRVTFPLFASDGSLTPGITLLSQISVDAASAVYGARPVEITANMGMYYLDLSASEMNGQTIAIVATPSGGGSGANVAVRSVPIVLYTQGPTAGFYAQLMSIDATPLDAVAANVWASPTRTLSSIDNVKGSIVSTVWATPSRSLTDWADIVNAVWATPSRTLSSFGALQTDIVNNVWATPTRTLSSFGSLQGDIVNAVWATPTRSLSDWGGIVNTVWATPSRTLTSFGTLQGDVVNAVWATPTRTLSSLENVKAGIVSSVWATPTRSLDTGVTVASGGITSASFGAGAIDAAALAANTIGASELAQDAAQEIADEVLNRDLAGGASGGARIVRDALRVLRNRVNANLGIVYQEDDSTTAWTFTVSTDSAATRITGIDPA